MSSSAAVAGSPSPKAFHSETCWQTPFGGLQSTKVRGNYGCMRMREERDDNDGGRGQGCWIKASVVEEAMQEQDCNYWRPGRAGDGNLCETQIFSNIQNCQ